jgi:hypothetical protein
MISELKIGHKKVRLYQKPPKKSGIAAFGTAPL